METLALTSANIYTPLEEFSPGALLIRGARIDWVGPQAQFTCPPGMRQIDLAGHIVCPGFIDLHAHGAMGFDFAQADPRQIAQILRYHLRQGTTGMLASVISRSPAATFAAIDRIKFAIQTPDADAATLLGIHLEGPYLNPERAGIHCKDALRSPDTDEFKACIQAAGGWLKMLTLAPELPGAMELINLARRENIIPALGHSAAEFEQARQAMDAGANYVTHIFNAMGGLHHRNPNLPGAAMLSPKVWVEAIADGVHLHPAVLRLLWRICGVRIVLATDASPLLGLSEGEYTLAEQGRFEVKSDRVVTPSGTLAASLLTLRQAAANMVQYCGCTVGQALELVTLNPARILGLTDTKGRLAAGMDADIAVLDANWRIKMVIKEGRLCA